LDAFTLRREKGGFDGLRVAIIGDILHSPRCTPEIHALNTLSVDELRVVGPETLLPAVSRP
jgi:aspartate carbamoyltransferase catalytic subunit